MPSDEYLRDLEMSAHLNRKQEIMLCPVCGRKIDKWVWRTTCCGAEIVWEDGYAEGMEVDSDDE
jgi:hypothetical protein